jgi:hypothetical protein
MLKPSTECAISPDFDLNYYVDASHDAAKRTRTVTIILVVACVLISIGWYNSLKWSWARDRVRQAYDLTDESIYKILRPDNPPTGNDPQAKRYRKQLQYATVNEYVENVRFVRVPFFGAAFDVNDLGTIGGLALITMLVLLRYSLSRETKNLNVSFEEAVLHGRLCAFYHALAMRQLFTVPHMKGETRNWKLVRLPEFVGVLPAIIFSLGVAYDFYSTFGWGIYSPDKVRFTHVSESVCLVLIWVTSLKCLGKKRHINSIWDKYWERMSAENKVQPSVIMLDKDLVEEFGSDEAVNSALRELLVKRSEANTHPRLSDAKELRTSVVMIDKELVKEFEGDVVINNALRELRKKRAEASTPAPVPSM